MLCQEFDPAVHKKKANSLRVSVAAGVESCRQLFSGLTWGRSWRPSSHVFFIHFCLASPFTSTAPCIAGMAPSSVTRGMAPLVTAYCLGGGISAQGSSVLSAKGTIWGGPGHRGSPVSPGGLWTPPSRCLTLPPGPLPACAPACDFIGMEI